MDDIFDPGTLQDATHQFRANVRYKGCWMAICECGAVVGQCLAKYAHLRTPEGSDVPVAGQHQCCPHCDASGPDKIKYVWCDPDG